MSYKWCAVPKCTNTSLKTPEKLFVSVPKNVEVRRKWLQLSRRDHNDIANKTNIFFCEDHFDMEKDMANYYQYKMGFSQKIILKDKVLPSKFHCQPDRIRRMCDAGTSRSAFVKRQRMELVKQCEDVHQSMLTNDEHTATVVETCTKGKVTEGEQEEICTSPDIGEEEIENDGCVVTEMTSSDTYQLKWHSHSAHLNGSVAALLRSERFTDVVLCTMDGSQIPAHKFILSSCSVYLSSLFDGQRSVMRMGGMLYVVLPSEITTKALKILVEYMYKGETTVSNEVLDTVLKAGEVLKIRGLWRQLDEAGGDSAPAEKIAPGTSTATPNKQQSIVKKPEEIQSKIALKKDDKVIKFNPMQTQGGVTRPMFIGPPKLVFIKTTEGGTQAALRPGAPLGTKGQTILVAPAPVTTQASHQVVATVAATPSTSVPMTTIADDSNDEAPPPRFLRRHAVERKYGKRQKTDTSVEGTKDKDKDKEDAANDAESTSTTTEIMIKDEPDWDASSIEEEERSIAEMFQQEMSVKSEPIDDLDIDIEESLVYSPLACELCAEVFTVPAAWVRHVQGHAKHDTTHARKRKHRSASDDTEETMALLRCDLCQKHFPNPAEWVRHVQSTHTETELAMSNNSAPPKRHNRFTDGVQNKICTHCNKTFPSHASMLIHMRTHTGERPFVCGLCNKGFNVKSNLLRHLRTLHEHAPSPARDEPPPPPPDVKREA